MKKLIASTTFIIAFTFFALYQNSAGQSALMASGSTPSTTVSASTAKAVPPPKKTVATATVTTGKYKDGVYTGSPVDAYYGNVQVQVKVANGKIANVTFLDYPQNAGTSRSINSYAMPQLTQEAIAAQSARVNGVSGASHTSAAFEQSLASALSQAA